ncbi:breast carcinoma-amplified sequence 1 isoform X16 [Silurus meridionalis]|uniref:breast carcinoma-amplified sequence 1 isoform X16 n=1 Tax=Silurus meridionalis TaxID=175797 RepID=UPI001EEBAC45|nr:breast carcinoma-amplified sequence 1 isoform X16 [Silurus meridionalis]
MGNRQSLTITHPETDHNEKKEKNDQPNGHAVSGLDLTDAVTCEASKPAPVTFTFNVKPTQASVETNGTKAKATTVSVEAVSATTASVEKEIPAESSTPTKDTSKPAGTPSMFNKMFKMKTGPADVAAEVAESQKSTPTSASIETNGIQAKAPSMTVDAPGLQISASTASTEKEVPTETSTPAKDTSKQAGTPSKFNMMFKKKPVAADVAAEVKIVPAVLTESQKSTPTQVSVATNGIQEKAPSVTVDANGIQISASTASADKEVPTETSTPAKDTSKQAGTPSKFNMMFKKKPGAADVATEVKIVPAVLTESQKSTPTQVSVATNGIQAKAPSVTVDATGIQISASTASAEKEVPTETSTPAKDTSKQAGTPSKFNMMFKKKPGAADVAAEVAESQKSTPTQVSVATNGIQAKAPSVTVDATGIQISASTASAEKEVPTETSTPAKDTSKQAGTPSKFNMMFKKKPGAADVAAEVAESQKSTPTSASIETNGIQANIPTVTVDAAGIQISASTASTEKEVPTESSTPAKDTSKQAGTPSKFNMMFKKKPVAADVAAEVKIVPKVVTESQKSTPTQVSVATNGIQAKAPSVTVDAAGLQISASTASTEKEVPTETSTPAKDTSKQAGTPSKFNMMFKKKPGAADVATEVKIVPAVLTESQKSTPTQVSVATNGIQAKAPSVTVDAPGLQISASTASAEKEVPTETSTPAKDTSKQAGTPSKFNMMFKKKPGAADVATEVKIVPAVLTESQKSTPTQVSVATNGIQAKAPSVTVDAPGLQISASTASAEKEVPTETSTPAKDTSKQAGTPSKFNMMFKKKPVAADVAAEVKIVPAVLTESQQSIPTQVSVKNNGIQAPSVTVDAAGIQINATTLSAEKETPAESGTAAKDTPKQAETPSMFNKMFKKKPGAADVAAEVTILPAEKTESQKFNEPTDIKASPQADKEPQNEALVLSTTVVTQDSTQSEQTGAEEKSVMNFFKTFVTSTKTTKEATPSPDVSKEQSQKETPPAPAANVQEASKVPPPPPPAPPKMESKAEPAVKKEQAPAVEVAAAAAKEPEAQSKAKTKDSPFSKIFRSKSEVKEEAKPVEIQVDASKASTLEVSAKPEHPPAPKPEEKKAEKKPSPFANLLKPKVLLGQVSSKIHAAASSASASISLGARGAATESKKQTPAAPTAPADAAPSTKAKEEPKQAASAAPAATSADNKSVGSTDNSSPSTSRKLEKRNSIHLFFKNLGQKRHSDAGVQTEPVAPEKAK